MVKRKVMGLFDVEVKKFDTSKADHNELNSQIMTSSDIQKFTAPATIINSSHKMFNQYAEVVLRDLPNDGAAPDEEKSRKRESICNRSGCFVS